MNAIKKWIRNFFGFSRTEVNGFVILLPLMLMIILSEPVYRIWLTNRKDDFSSDKKLLDSLSTFWDQKKDSSSATIPATEFFAFNPNSASRDDFKRLGFPDALSTRIVNYRQKGGQFRIKSDLLKIYAFDSSLYHRLYAYIVLPQKASVQDKNPSVSKSGKKTGEKNSRSVQRFNLNNADSTQLKSVYGIGSKLAARILKFRNGLGGFIKKEQLKEVYGLDSIVVEKLYEISFITEDFVPVKINLNSTSEKDFISHPYIKRYIAKAIVAYRFQHGDFKDIEELRKLDFIKPGDIEKILPYLTVDH